jgi:hypothetical protein
MKICIWCRKHEQQVTFNNKAHTVPESLGGINLCKNVCDDCNSYFGNARNGYPSIEAILKDTFGISRSMLSLRSKSEKNKHIFKFSTSYFKVDIAKGVIKIKQSYTIHRGFQERVCRQLKKGIYKMYLEERERQLCDALDDRFNFIREFARHDLGDPPVLYFLRGVAVILVAEPITTNPVLFINETKGMNYLINHPHFYEFEFLSHVFSIPTVRNWELDFDNYIRNSVKEKTKFFKGWRMVQKFNDIDLTLSIFNDSRK